MSNQSNSRNIKSGYPITTPFKSREEALEYLSHEKITCLMCGKTLKAMGQHLTAKHDMTTVEYKRQFGIPINWGLLAQYLKPIFKACGHRLNKTVTPEQRSNAQKLAQPTNIGREPDVPAWMKQEMINRISQSPEQIQARDALAITVKGLRSKGLSYGSIARELQIGKMKAHRLANNYFVSLEDK